MHKQNSTIDEINTKIDFQEKQLIGWYDNLETGPADKPWVNIQDPFWAIRYINTYLVKEPSLLFPLGIGQSEQFGFYKKITRWSSTYDTDMVEEMSNYERLINGNIDFSFLVIFLLPLLLIILTYNVNGLEKDLKFHKLISVQNRRINYWIFNRLLFYLILILFSIDVLILGAGILNNMFADNQSIWNLVLISNIYIISFAVIFCVFNNYSSSSSYTAFQMISIWLIFCVIVPGSVHQYASFKYPVNYMTDFLDVNRKQTYEVFKLDNLDHYDILLEIHPELVDSEKVKKMELDKQLIRRSISTIINQMNINASNQIEMQNEEKNRLIRLSYFLNPVSFVQNLWNSCTSTDYNAYKDFRLKIQKSIDVRNKLIVLESWNEKKVDKVSHLEYLKVLNNN